MLCQQCHQQEATVHLTVVPWPSSEPTQRDFCPACYPEVEAVRAQAYSAKPQLPQPVGLEFMIPVEFLQTANQPDLDSVGQPCLIYALERLATRPSDTGQRLAFELLPWLWHSLERGQDPQWDQLTLVVSLWSPKDQPRFDEGEYADWLEKIAIRCVALRSLLPTPPGEHGPFALTLSMALTALGLASRPRFTAFVEKLKKHGADPALDPRWKLISLVEQHVTHRRRKP